LFLLLICPAVLLRLALKTKFDKMPLFPEIVFHEIHGFTCQGKSFRNASSRVRAVATQIKLP
jgi:hypothetical protein